MPRDEIRKPTQAETVTAEGLGVYRLYRTLRRLRAPRGTPDYVVDGWLLKDAIESDLKSMSLDKKIPYLKELSTRPLCRSNPFSLTVIAGYLANIEELDASRGLFARAIEIYPTDNAHDLAGVNVAISKYTETVLELRKRNEGSSKEKRGKSQEINQQIEEDIKYLIEASRGIPAKESRIATMLVLPYLRATTNENNALQEGRKYEELYANSPLGLAEIGAFYYEKQKYRQSLEVTGKALKILPDESGEDRRNITIIQQNYLNSLRLVNQQAIRLAEQSKWSAAIPILECVITSSTEYLERFDNQDVQHELQAANTCKNQQGKKVKRS